MASLKSLAKDTAVYGLSSIIGRFLNWLLVPMYTYVFLPEEYGVVSYVYAFIAIATVVLTYGMETGFFRFASHHRWQPMQVYSTALLSLAATGTAFCCAAFMFSGHVARWLQCEGHTSYAMIMVVCVALDAFSALPFSYLRYQKKAGRFAVLKLINIGVNIACNLFFILLCPWLMERAPGAVDWFYRPDFGIGYIFLSNLIATTVTLLLLTPQLRGFQWRFIPALWWQIVCYSFPLMLAGVMGIMNQTISTLLFPYLYPGSDAAALDQLGIYNANYKLAMVMVMFIQAFRFAFEPFIFEKGKTGDKDALLDPEKLRTIATATKYFAILSFFIFLGVMYYLDIVKIIISSKYYSGLAVVPVLMLGELFFGINFCLNTWYKLTDRTAWGTVIYVVGFAVTILINVLLVPRYGYWGCAWAAFMCYLVMMVVNYVAGRRYINIPYATGRVALYAAVTAGLYALGMYIAVTPWAIVNYLLRAALLCAFAAIVMRAEHLSAAEIVKPILSKIKR